MIKVNQETYARLIVKLMEESCSVSELVEHTGLHRVTVLSLMRTFRKFKLVHVVSWEKDCKGRDCMPVFAFGKGKNKPRDTLSRAEVMRRYLGRKKQIGTLHMMVGK